MRTKNNQSPFWAFFLIFFTISLVSSLFLYTFVNRDVEKPKNSDGKNEGFLSHSDISENWNRSAENGYEGITYSIAVDSEDNVYTVGSNETSSGTEIQIQKYDNTGNSIWNRTRSGDSFGSYDEGRDIAIDSQDNLYVIGTVNYGDMILLKYNKDGNYLWNQTYEGSLSTKGNAITIDSSDNIYVAGDNKLTINDDYEVFIQKYNSSGSLKWTKSKQVSNSTYCEDLTISTAGYLYLVGWNQTLPLSAKQTYVMKYSSSDGDSEPLWIHSISGWNNSEAVGVDTDSSENIYITITNITVNSNKQLVLMKLNSSGDQKWFNVYNNQSKSGKLYIDKAGDEIYVTGTNNTMGDQDVLILKYNSTGELLLNYSWGVRNGENNIGTDLSLDSSSHIYFVTLSPRLDLVKLKKLWLSSNADNPDSDGMFELSWSGLINAENYTLYENESSFSEITGDLTIITEGLTNQSYKINKNQNGTFYYVIQAFNSQGNTTSECISVTISLPPAPFDTVTNEADVPDNDGIFNISWTAPSRARNYSLFYSNKSISEFNETVIEYANGITDTRIEMSLASGEYYLVVVAFNNVGNSTSTSIFVDIEIMPGSFSLTSDAGDPDVNGAFEITWSSSSLAVNYSLYYSESTITDVEAPDVMLLYNGTGTSYAVSEWAEGSFYFVVVAENEYGETKTEMITITVDLPNNDKIDDNEDDSSDDGMPWWLRAALTGAISATVGLIIKQTYSARKKRKEMYEKMERKLQQIDNMQKFFREKLPDEDWNKLKDAYRKYEQREISKRDFIKEGRKSVGDRFISIFGPDKK